MVMLRTIQALILKPIRNTSKQTGKLFFLIFT
jgi:hypothetical protein